MTGTEPKAVPAGQPHHTLTDVEVVLHDYDDLTRTVVILPAGSTFQPWEPAPHWQGVQVPISLGQGAEGFDWGVTSPTGHFLNWCDFFTLCRPGPGPDLTPILVPAR